MTDLFTPIFFLEALGWLASALTVCTYAMNTMLPLRIFAMSSAVCFIVYASILQIWPLLGMELCLLPINAFRLWQLLSLRRRVRDAREGSVEDFSVIQRYGKAHTLPAGTTVFQSGDPVDKLYFLSQGSVVVEDFGLELEAPTIFGEIAFFTETAARTATVRCLKPATVYTLDETQFMRLQFEDPTFGMSVMRTVARRLQQNAAPLADQKTA